MKGCIFVSFRYLDTDTITKSWLKMYLRSRYRSKLGWFFWFGPIHVTIRRNLASLFAVASSSSFLPSFFLPSPSFSSSLSPSDVASSSLDRCCCLRHLWGTPKCGGGNFKRGRREEQWITGTNFGRPKGVIG